MYFGCMYRTIFKANGGKPFHLSPPSSPISFTQAPEVADRVSRRYRLSVRDLPDYFKIHRVFIKTSSVAKLKQQSNGEVQRGRERQWENHEKQAARPPLQRVVRLLSRLRRPSFSCLSSPSSHSLWSALARSLLYSLPPLYLLVFSSLSVPFPLRL